MSYFKNENLQIAASSPPLVLFQEKHLRSSKGNMDALEDGIRRNGYNRKHAYDSLFDDHEDNHSCNGITSVGTWHDDVSAISDISPKRFTGHHSSSNATPKNTAPKSLNCALGKNRKNNGQLHVFGASRFSWQDTDDEENSLDEPLSECLHPLEGSRHHDSVQTMRTATITYSSEAEVETSQSETTEIGRSCDGGNAASRLRRLQTFGLEHISEYIGIQDKMTKIELLASDSTDEVDKEDSNLGPSLQKLMLTPLAACFSCEPGKEAFEDNLIEKKIQRQSKVCKKASPTKRSPGKGSNRKYDHSGDLADPVPSWVMIS